MLVKKITLLGHKDHGKSTLIGNMLILTGRVNPAKFKEAERLSKSLGKRFEPGFILDSFHEEREGGLTIDTTRTEKIPYNKLALEFIDVPGHEELIKNMISGASYADMALLIVSAKGDEGIREQTKRHLFIARMLGIRKLVVAVNKMDLVGYKREAFDRIRADLGGFIEQIGFSGSKVHFVPVSAYYKENLTKISKNMRWYTGKPLLELLYANAVARDADASGNALRVVVQGFVDHTKTFIGGKVVSGSMRVGDRVCLMPSDLRSSVSEIVVKARRVKRAEYGASVAFRLKDGVRSEVRGSVLSGMADLPKVSRSVRSLIFITNPLGKRPMVRFNGVDIECRALKVVREIDTTTGEKPKGRKAGLLDAIEADVDFGRKMATESYEKTRELGRFLVYSKDRFAGIGIVE